MATSMLTSTQKYAAGALLALALRQAQMHQSELGSSFVDDKNANPDRPSSSSRSSSLSGSDVDGDSQQFWTHPSRGLLRPVFRFLDIDSKAWPGLEETAASADAKHHILAYLSIMVEEDDGESSEKNEQEFVLAKSVDIMAMSLETAGSSEETTMEICDEGNTNMGKFFESTIRDQAIYRLNNTGDRGSMLADVSIIYPRKVAILFELLSACVADSPQDYEKASTRRKGYDARHRIALRHLATWLDVNWMKMVMDTIRYQRNRTTTRRCEDPNTSTQPDLVRPPAADPASPTGGPSVTSMERMMENMMQLMAMQQQRIDQLMNMQQQRAEMDARHQAPPPVVVQQLAPPLPGKIVSEFQKLKPPTFDGEAAAGGLDEWIDGMENCFRVQQSSEEDKILLTPFQLRNAAYNWWKQLQGELEANNWEYFKEKLADRFLPPSIKKQLRDSFLHLKQEGMTVTEYEREFTRLLKYGAEFVPTERAKMEHFKDGLRINIRSFVTVCMSTTLAGTLNCALENVIKCFGCGMRGHVEKDCHAKDKTCSKCNKKGHFAKYCYIAQDWLKQKKDDLPAQQQNQGGKQQVKAKVYTLTEVDPLEDNDVVAGIGLSGAVAAT